MSRPDIGQTRLLRAEDVNRKFTTSTKELLTFTSNYRNCNTVYK